MNIKSILKKYLGNNLIMLILFIRINTNINIKIIINFLFILFSIIFFEEIKNPIKPSL